MLSCATHCDIITLHYSNDNIILHFILVINIIYYIYHQNKVKLGYYAKLTSGCELDVIKIRPITENRRIFRPSYTTTPK